MQKSLLNIYTDKSDEFLIEKVRNNSDSEAFKEVCKRYENIFFRICQRYATSLTYCGISVNDIFEEKNYIIFHCISTFKPSKKTKLSTWIGNYARYLCLNSINSRRFILPNIDEDSLKFLEESKSTEEYTANQIIPEDYNYMLKIVDQIGDKRASDILKLRYLSDKKMIWDSVAKKMKMSIQTTINLHNNGMKILRSKMKNKKEFQIF